MDDYPDDDSDDGGPAFMATFSECQRCHWKGMVGEGQWECPKCGTDWQEVSLTVPAKDVDAILKALSPVLAPFIKEERDA